MTPVSISQLVLYNPQRISDELAEKLFIIRKKIFALLMKKISDEQPNSIPQHHLIIGLRGMGKSTLLKRIEVELRGEKYRESYIPLLPPEEQYNLSNLAEFWLNSLDALANTLELEKNMEMTERVDEQIRKLELIKDSEKGAREAFDFLKKISKELGKRPVLLIDNLNLAFDRFSKEEQHTLRAWLMQNNAPILVGASAVTIDDTLNYGAPFYDAFQQHYIKKLTFGESMSILTHLAKLTGSDEMLPQINQKTGRLKTIHHLTGGNPRTAVLLFRFIAKGFSPELKDDLDAMLDEITPLYKHRFESLSPAQQKILDAIALHWDPINLPDLRKATRLENSQLSPQLKRMYDAGWIDKLDAYQVKGHAYQMSERFFNIWFLMRRSSRRQKRALLSLSKFLECFYGEKLPELAQGRLTHLSIHADDITLNLAMADALKNESLAERLRDKSYEDIHKLGETNPQVLKMFDVPSKKQIEGRKLFKRYIRLYSKGDFKNSEPILKELAERMDHSIFYAVLGDLYQNQLNNFEKAEKSYFKAIELDEKFALSWNGLGDLYQNNLNRFEEAEKSYLKAIELDEKFAFSWNGLGDLYQNNLNRFEEAEKSYLKAIELDEKFTSPWNGLGDLYQDELNRFEEAEKAYLKAIELDEEFASPWNRLGDLYQDKLNRFEEAEKAYLKAIKVDDKKATLWKDLGFLYQNKLNRFEEAEKAYLKAIELDDKYTFGWFALGSLYQSEFSRFEEAEKAYLKAIELDDEYAFGWFALGSLYQNEFSRFEEAEKAYLKAIELDDEYAFGWFALGSLYQNEFSRFEEAEKAYLKAIELDDKEFNQWNSLGNLYQDYLKEYKKAETAYLKSIENDSNDPCSKYNLVFLYRDKINMPEKAKTLFKEIELNEKVKDSHFLNESLFALYEKNAGIAADFLKKAFEAISEQFPSNTEDDWMRFASVVGKLGYSDWFLEIMENTGHDISLAPYFTAIKALNEKDTEGYLLSRAVEIREPARQIIEMIKRFD